MKKNQYKTVFVSDIHLWHPKNQWNKLITFLDSINFENLIIVWDFIDYRQLNRFGRWWKKEKDVLDYINNLSKKWINITYIQWNHDRKFKSSDKIKIDNMTICRDLHYKTWKWKSYYITHWDCMDWINKDWGKIWQLWSLMFWLLFKIEFLRNKNVYKNSYLSIAEKFEEWIKKRRMPDEKINKLIIQFSKNLNCDWIIIWHFHLIKHYKIHNLDYYCTWDWLTHHAAVVENLEWELELITM